MYYSYRLRMRTFSHIFVFTYVFTSILGVSVAAQDLVSENTSVYSISTQEGLSQSTINVIYKDSDGFIWIGTEDGLNRFDGYSFKIFKHIVGDTLSLSGNIIKSIHEDSKKRLWIGTERGGLNYYDKLTETFRAYDMNESNVLIRSFGSVNHIWENERGHLMLSTYHGLNEFDPETRKLIHVYQSDNREYNSESTIWCSLADHHGTIWAGTNRGLILFNPADRSFRRFYLNDLNRHTPSRFHIRCIYRDKKNDIWIGTRNEGLFRYNSQTGQVDHFYSPGSVPEGVSARFINKVTGDAEGNVYISTEGEGTYLYHSAEGRFSKIDVGNKKVREIYLDGDTRVWFGTGNDGIRILDFKSNVIGHVKGGDDFDYKSGKNSVLALASDPEGNVWVGTDGLGLFRKTGTRDEYISYRHDPNDSASLSGDVVKSLLVSSDGKLYAGTFRHGLNVLDLSTGAISRYTYDSVWPANNIWSLCEDGDGRIWMGTLGAGLMEFLPGEGRYVRVNPYSENTDARLPRYISRIFEDSHKNLWIGTEGEGLFRYDRDSEIFETGFFENPAYKAMSDYTVYDIVENSEGELFVSISGVGLCRYDESTEKFVQIKAPMSLENSIKNILEDQDGRLWLSGKAGVIRFDPKTLNEAIYTFYDGVLNSHFNYNAKLKSRDGFYFGGLSGITAFNPNALIREEHSLQLAITNLYINHREVEVGSETLKNQITYTSEVTIGPGQNVFSLRYVALDYHFPKRNKYAYMLEGFDKDWNYVNEQRLATYTNLPEGTYLFRVKATDRHGNWVEGDRRLVVNVLPVWHQTFLARAIMVVLLAVFIFMFVRFRTRIQATNKARLEKKVKARTRQYERQKVEITSKNKDLEQLNRSFKEVNAKITCQNEKLLEINKKINAQRLEILEKSEEIIKANQEVSRANTKLSKINANLEKLVDQRTLELRETMEKLIKTDEGLNTFLYRSSHDLRGPITTIIGLVNLSLRENRQEELASYFKKINSSCLQMLNFLHKLHETNMIFSVKDGREQINWNKILSDIFAELGHLDVAGKVSLTVENRIRHTVISNEILIKSLMHNLLENAIIFSKEEEGHVKLSLELKKDELQIRVSDNGIGIEPGIQKDIYLMFFRGSEQSKGNGLGLYLTKKSVEMLNGKISLKSEVGGYTEFTVLIPVMTKGVVKNKLPQLFDRPIVLQA